MDDKDLNAKVAKDPEDRKGKFKSPRSFGNSRKGKSTLRSLRLLCVPLRLIVLAFLPAWREPLDERIKDPIPTFAAE
jgi:hypothetical protein